MILDYAEFETRFPRITGVRDINGIANGDIHVDRDAIVSGMVCGSLSIEESAHAVFSGILIGEMYVASEASVWIDGIVEGAVHVEGAAFVTGMCRRLIAAPGAITGKTGIAG